MNDKRKHDDYDPKAVCTVCGKSRGKCRASLNLVKRSH